MKKWNLQNSSQNSGFGELSRGVVSSKNILIVSVCLLVMAFAGHADSAEPNNPGIDINDIIIDANLIKPGDGLIFGVMTRESAAPGEGKLLGEIAYQYGVSKFYFLGDLEKQKYFEIGTEFESRDIAEQGSVYGLSKFILMFTPEQYMVTGVAGFGYGFGDIEQNVLTSGGINVRPNQDKNTCFAFRAVTPVDRGFELRAGLSFKF